MFYCTNNAQAIDLLINKRAKKCYVMSCSEAKALPKNEKSDLMIVPNETSEYHQIYSNTFYSIYLFIFNGSHSKHIKLIKVPSSLAAYSVIKHLKSMNEPS